MVRTLCPPPHQWRFEFVQWASEDVGVFIWKCEERGGRLESPLLGVSDGAPNVEDKLIRKSEVSEGLV